MKAWAMLIGGALLIVAAPFAAAGIWVLVEGWGGYWRAVGGLGGVFAAVAFVVVGIGVAVWGWDER